MSVHRQCIVVPTAAAKRIQEDLAKTSGFVEMYEEYGKDYTETYTARFDDGIEVDVKVCMGDPYDGSEVNPLWTEAVLFRNGFEQCASEPGDELFGEWEMECDGNTYVVEVVAG